MVTVASTFPLFLKDLHINLRMDPIRSLQKSSATLPFHLHNPLPALHTQTSSVVFLFFFFLLAHLSIQDLSFRKFCSTLPVTHVGSLTSTLGLASSLFSIYPAGTRTFSQNMTNSSCRCTNNLRCTFFKKIILQLLHRTPTLLAPRLATVTLLPSLNAHHIASSVILLK